MRSHSMQRFNMLKVCPNVLTSRMNNYIKGEFERNPLFISNLENEFKVELGKELGKNG